MNISDLILQVLLHGSDKGMNHANIYIEWPLLRRINTIMILLPTNINNFSSRNSHWHWHLCRVYQDFPECDIFHCLTPVKNCFHHRFLDSCRVFSGADPVFYHSIISSFQWRYHSVLLVVDMGNALNYHDLRYTAIIKDVIYYALSSGIDVDG